jgi:hypothetical protein
MTKEFISYEQALALKELGFDEACICYYDIEDSYRLKPTPMKEEINAFHFNSTSIMIAAPLYQQAFRWFREAHRLVALIDIGMHEFSYKIFKNEKSITPFKDYLDYNGTYEEAELECLKKLIEIVNTKEK